MKTKSTSPKKSTSSVKPTPSPATTPLRRKNAKRFDIAPDDKQDAVISSRVSTAMKKRTVAAAPMFGLKNHSEVIEYALARFFNQSEQILEAHRNTGVLPMSLVAMKAFRALGPAPEEIEYARKWMPEKVEQLGVKRLQIENTLNEILARLAEVERRVKIKQLEPEKKAEEPVRVEVDLV